MAALGSQATYFYRSVIDDVIQRSKPLFAEERIDASVLTQLVTVRTVFLSFPKSLPSHWLYPSNGRLGCWQQESLPLAKHALTHLLLLARRLHIIKLLCVVCISRPSRFLIFLLWQQALGSTPSPAAPLSSPLTTATVQAFEALGRPQQFMVQSR